jgi:hypothetical protein
MFDRLQRLLEYLGNVEMVSNDPLAAGKTSSMPTISSAPSLPIALVRREAYNCGHNVRHALAAVRREGRWSTIIHDNTTPHLRTNAAIWDVIECPSTSPRSRRRPRIFVSAEE